MATDTNTIAQLPYDKIIEILDILITIVGDVKLSEAKSFADVEANAEELRSEGHDEIPPVTPAQ